ncbi:WD40 repeat-like protein, partial [Polyporus arcularius HHB13444]
VSAVCISPCERYVATSSWDWTIRLWSTRDGEHLWTFENDHTGWATHLLFSLDGRFLASGDHEGRVRI